MQKSQKPETGYSEESFFDNKIEKYIDNIKWRKIKMDIIEMTRDLGRALQQ